MSGDACPIDRLTARPKHCVSFAGLIGSIFSS
jgi:hypothetical protein